MNCPFCGEEVEGEDAGYGIVYVCDCGPWILIKLKTLKPKMCQKI